MPVLPLIAQPAGYTACMWDLARDRQALDYWLDHFVQHTRKMYPLLLEGSDEEPPQTPERADAFVNEILAGVEQRRKRPEQFAPLTILDLDAFRKRLLDKYRFHDPYKRIKEQENRSAVQFYPAVIEELSKHSDPRDLLLALIENLFAGNIFDMGSLAVADQYHANGHDFLEVRSRLTPNRWLVNDFDLLANRLPARGYRKVLFFVDNAGSDAVLGCVPLARQLALWGATVVLAANSQPALNDITYAELLQLLDELARWDDQLSCLLADGSVSAVPTGNDVPLIDLSQLSQECCQAAEGADLLILEGMGRAVESNYHVAFTCDCLKVAMLKDQFVATRLGGKLYDCVCRFEPV